MLPVKHAMRQSTDSSQQNGGTYRVVGLPIDELVRRHHKPMLAFAQSMGMSSASAEEIVQETWLTVLDNPDQFEGRSSVLTWLMGIVRNLVLRRRASEFRVSQHECPLPHESDPLEDRMYPEGHQNEGHWQSPPQRRFLPEGHILGKEIMTIVQTLADNLPTRQRQVLVLRDINGLTAEETAVTLGITDQVQRALLYRARANIRNELEKGYLRDDRR